VKVQAVNDGIFSIAICRDAASAVTIPETSD
jgi:hypothetical protein